MALSIFSHKEEDQDEDDLLAVDFFNEDRGATFVPLLTEQLKIGISKSDQSSQTQITEIIEIGQLKKLITVLKHDLSSVKRELKFAKQVMVANFEQKLEDEALSIHSKQIERLKNIEKQHEDRVAVLRRSFKQQLQDAIILIQSQYKKDLDIKIKEATADTKENDYTHVNNFQRMLERANKDLMKANETIVQRDEEVAHLKQHLVNSINENKMYDPSEVLKTKQLLEEQTRKFTEQNDRLDQIKIERRGLKNELKDLKSQIRSKERQIVDLQSHNAEIKDNMLAIEIQQKLEKPIKLNSQHIKIDTNKSVSKVNKTKKTEDHNNMIPLEKYKNLQDSLKILQDQHESNIQQALASERNLKESLVRDLKNEIKELTKKLNAKEQGKNTIVKFRKNSGDLNEKLIHQRWAKKFQILHASLHAIKEESYIRSQLHKKLKNNTVISQNFNISPQQEFCTSVVSLPQQGFEQTTYDDHQKSRKSIDQIVEEEEIMTKDFDQLEFNQDPIDETDLSFVQSQSPSKAIFGHYMPTANFKNIEN